MSHARKKQVLITAPRQAELAAVLDWTALE